MERLQIYDRTVGEWTSPALIIVGFEENWVLDRTTDFCKGIKFKWTSPDIEHPEKQPPFSICDWVILLHIDDDSAIGSYPARFNTDGSPENHSQYIIGDIVSEYNGIDGYWWVNLSLVEPIERFRGVLGETLSYTNNAEPYYNHLTALERWLKVTPANCDNYATGYDKAKNIGWYNRVTISQEDRSFLASLPFADTTLNELSLYELLLDVYDSAVGRTPVVYFDVDGLGNPKNKERDEYILRFEKQDGSDKAIVPMWDLVENCAGTTYTKTGANYATGLISNVDNLAPAETVIFPAENLYAVPEVDNNDRVLNVPPYIWEKSEDKPIDDWVIKLPFPIKNIKRVIENKMQLSPFASGAAQRTISRTNTDVTNDVYEVRQYNSIEKFDGDASFSDNKKFWYKEGEYLFHIRKYRTKDVPNALVYRIEYEPLINTRVKCGSDDFCLQLNQSSSQVDSNKFGKFVNAYLEGMDKADLVIKKAYKGSVGFNKFKDLIGSRVEDILTKKEYMITAVSYRNRNFIYDVFFQLNEKHMRKSNNYTASQSIRTNTGIPTDNVKDRRTVIARSIKLELEDEHNAAIVGGSTVATEKPLINLDQLLALSALVSDNVARNKMPQVAVLASADKKTLMPICKYIFGKQLNIVAQFEDNASAGKRKILPTASFNPDFFEAWIGKVVGQIPILYTNSTGRIERCGFSLAAVTNDNLADITNGGYSEIENTAKILKLLANLPLIDVASENMLNSVVKINNQMLLKDSMERVSENIVIDVVSESIIICSGLLKLSRLMTNVRDGVTKLRFFDNNMTEAADENISFGAEATNLSYTFGGTNCIMYSFTPFTKKFKSVIITAEGAKTEKLLIINDLDGKNSKTMAQINSGKLNIYYS